MSGPLSPAPKAFSPAPRKILLATAVGVVYGFQSWRLARYGFDLLIPWYGTLWIILGHALLGSCIGMSSKAARSWKRGPILGLAFGFPSAAVAYWLGFRVLPYDLTFVIGGIIGGLLIGLIVDSAFERTMAPIEPNPVRCDVGNDHAAAEAEEWLRARRVQRLVEGKARLDRLDAERRSRGKEGLGKNVEDRIVWAELLELEIQEIDEELRRICREAWETPGVELPDHSTKGGRDEHIGT